MNPMSLLTKGRTFGGFKDRRGAYKLSAGYALPNFAGSKGPSFGPARPQKEPASPFAQPKPAVEAVVPPKRAGAVPIAPKVMGKTLEIWPAPPGICLRAARWFEEILGRRPRPAWPAPSVQTEMVLDKVTVVRNDLSEDDVVVVLAEKTMSEKVEPERQMTNP
jgi:hypothetical protein